MKKLLEYVTQKPTLKTRSTSTGSDCNYSNNYYNDQVCVKHPRLLQ
jgi:hypothetical protein